MLKLVSRLLPVNSQRRMFFRVARSILQEPATFTQRLSPENLKNFSKFREEDFFCPICAKAGRPLYDFPDVELRRRHHVGILRETLQCRHCFSSMRQRALAHVLIQEVNKQIDGNSRTIADLVECALGGLSLLDTDAFSAISSQLKVLPAVSRCSYLPHLPWGQEISPRYFNIDLQRIGLSDASYDIILSSDVMEHVRDSKAAHAEIFRVLKPGGLYIFTVPFEKSCDENITLVDTTGDADVHLCEPHIHGDPLSGGILAYRIFGWGLIAELKALGFKAEFLEIDSGPELIVAGDVIVASKPEP